MARKIIQNGMRGLCTIAVILGACAATPARADSVAFSNLGSPNAFSTSTGWEVYPGVDVATQFTTSGNVAVSQIDVAVGNITGVPAGVSNGVNFAIYTGASGSPASLFASFPELTSFTDFGSGQCAGLACTVETLKPVGTLSLQGGVPYWLVASAGGASTDAVWNSSDLAGNTVEMNQNGGTWMTGIGVAGAFDVIGSVTDSSSGSTSTSVGSPVPEPPVALLLAIGLCALGGMMVRKTYSQPRTS